jgi:hypothetical protein
MGQTQAVAQLVLCAAQVFRVEPGDRLLDQRIVMLGIDDLPAGVAEQRGVEQLAVGSVADAGPLAVLAVIGGVEDVAPVRLPAAEGVADQDVFPIEVEGTLHRVADLGDRLVLGRVMILRGRRLPSNDMERQLAAVTLEGDAVRLDSEPP